LKIQITFDKPLDISIGSKYDHLTVDFIKYQNLWYSNEIFAYLDEKSFHIEKMIQKQMPNTQATKSLLGFGNDSKSVLLITLALAFLMNLLLSG
jgi:hypothetical protein